MTTMFLLTLRRVAGVVFSPPNIGELIIVAISKGVCVLKKKGKSKMI